MAEKTFKAFKIVSGFSLPGGRRYKRADYYQAKSTGEEEVLMIAQFAHELEPGAHAPTPIPRIMVASVPLAVLAPEQEKQGDQPEWSYMTKTAMRGWLDRCGVDLPGRNASKPSYETLCSDAWTAGRRPHPLYGFPGGPTPSAGESVAIESGRAALAEAIKKAHAGGFEVSPASEDALEELTNPQAAPAEQDTREGLYGVADETIADEATEPSGSTIGALTGIPGSETAQDLSNADRI